LSILMASARQNNPESGGDGGEPAAARLHEEFTTGANMPPAGLADPGAGADRPLRMLAATLAAFLAAAAVFVSFPAIDLSVSALFFEAPGSFEFGDMPLMRTVREGFNYLFVAGCVAIAIGLGAAVIGRRRPFGLGWVGWSYLALCLALGPGLVANTLLKDNWGRARPVQIEAFGGDRAFSPALALSDQCERNCSFVSGEASSIYMLFIAFAMMLPAWRMPLMLAALAFGTAAGFVRIAAGGHFLSDVVFAGLFMALVAQGLLLALAPAIARERAKG
jgi:lipid A 4'-phosphatase